MSTDWIKMRVDLRSHPKVVRMASALRADRLRVIGGLFAVWSIFDAHSVDGVLEGYTFHAVDDDLGWKGFAEAMSAVEWLVNHDGAGLGTPRFEEHNGQSAKRRAMENERKRADRKADKLETEDGQVSASGADKKRTREEKKRKEKEKPSVSPRATRKCPEGFAVTAEMREWACIEAVGVDVDRETAKFRDYTFKTARSDWLGTWKNWIREAFDRLPKATASVETFQQRAARERVAQMSPRLAAKAPGAQPATEVIDGSTKLIA